MKILETKRFYLRELNFMDAENTYHLNSDPEVLKYTGDRPFASIDQAGEFLNQYKTYQDYGFGRWAVIDQETEVFLGWCGLKYTPECDEYDIGFRFFKNYWNKGFASEAARACVELGFSKFKIPKIVGRAMEENKSSIRVLEKIGFQFSKKFSFNSESWLIYEIENKKSVSES